MKMSFYCITMSHRNRLLLFPVLLFLSVSVFAQTGGLKGKVRNNSGDGIANAAVIVRREDKNIKSAKSDAKGNFRIEGLATGK